MRLFLLFLMIALPCLLRGEEETVVESKTAHYDGEKITLTGDVSVENAMGRLTAQQAILRRDEMRRTKIDFPWIELSTDVALTLSNGSTVHCQNMSLDYTEMSCLLFGNPQVIYKTEGKEVFADQARIDYEEREGSIKPTKITLTEHVRLVNHGSKEEPSDQYALADCLIYFPDAGFMVLESKTNRVLFYDKERGMQLSARTVHAKRDPLTLKESIQGLGDVRFVFGPEELRKLTDRFQWEKAP